MHNEELAACGIRVHGSCHGQNAWCVCQIVFKVVLCEFSFDGIAGTAHACAVRAAALNHKAADNSVENQTVIESAFHQTDKVIYCIWGDFRI